MQNLTRILSKAINQRIFNGVIFTILLIWIIAKIKYVYYSSGYDIRYKYDLLMIIALIYLSQTIFNKTWINSLTSGIYTILMGYVIYTFIYAFFDEKDSGILKEYGVLIKSCNTVAKLSILTIILWFTAKARPAKSFDSIKP